MRLGVGGLGIIIYLFFDNGLDVSRESLSYSLVDINGGLGAARPRRRGWKRGDDRRAQRAGVEGAGVLRAGSADTG